MAAPAGSPIIIKKVKKVVGGHGGGAWKIAYADFVTAMMAFFLLLWLLNSVTQEQLEGISNYFAPVSASMATSGSGGILGGQVMSEEGAATSMTAQDSVTVELTPPKAGEGGEAESEDETDPSNMSEQEKQAVEEEQFNEAKDTLEETLNSMPQLKQFAESLMVDNTPEGLRIQIVDQDGLAMFPSGGAEMYLHTRRIIEMVSKIILKMPQKLAISGHTDAVPFVTQSGYSNWELSADRANSARRELLHFNIPEERIGRIVGRAATEPLIVDDPKNSRNRRLSIVLLRGTGEGAGATVQKSKPVPEVLPGLNNIRKLQLEQDGPSEGPRIELVPNLLITPTLDAQ